MDISRSQFQRILKGAVIASAAVIILGYAAWRSFDYARGPRIEVFQPADGATVASSTAAIAGRADRVKSLTIDGSPASFDESGNFSDTIVVFPGVNVVYFAATDQFGRSTEAEVRIFGSVPLPVLEATTTR